MTSVLSVFTDALGGFLGDLMYGIVATVAILIVVYRDKVRDLYRNWYGDEESDGAIDEIDSLDEQADAANQQIDELRRQNDELRQLVDDNAKTNEAILETLESINQKLETAEAERREMRSRVDAVVAALRDHDQFTVSRYGEAEVIYPKQPDADDPDSSAGNEAEPETET